MWQRQVISERQTLIRRAAELEHDNDDKIGGLAEAHASAAQELARLDGIAPGSPDEADRLNEARSHILGIAIAHRIGAAKNAQAVALFDRVKDTLTPADRRALEVPIGAAADDDATDAWLKRESSKNDTPLVDRAGLDDGLTDMQRHIVRAKIAARESADESRRFATVKGLDDRLTAATAATATQPALYRTGTLAGLAGAYDAAGASERATETRRLALLEPFFRSFAQLGVAAQQRHLETLAGLERAMAEEIMNHQADAFARDPYAAGTALYPEVGPQLPTEDTAGRLAQARMIEARRGTASSARSPNEIAAHERDAKLTPVNLSPNEEIPGTTPVPSDADNNLASNAVEISQATPDNLPIDVPRRGVAPPPEPPSNSQDLEKTFRIEQGVKVTLPDGSHISDPSAPTGHVMAPFNDLKEVAAAGKRAREQFTPGPPVHGEVKERVLKPYLGQGGTYDYQRRASKFGKDGFTQLPQFRNISNVNVGLFCHQFGLDLNTTLIIAGLYALRHSRNSSWSKPYFLDEDTKKYIEIGYKLGESGMFD